MPTYARFIMIIALSVLINTQTISAAQADEFGDRFWNQSASGFGEPTADPQNALLATDMDAMAAALQNIQPAAGKEITEPPEQDQAQEIPAASPLIRIRNQD